jgi:hypothetical protein
MKQPQPLTAKQQTILKHIYRYRFLNRTHIQNFMHHKEKKRSSTWLKDLRTKGYIEWIYNPNDFALKTRPAIYYLNLEGIRYLRILNQFPADGLRKRYRESQRQPDFIERCLLVAGACVTLASPIECVSYSFITESDYSDPEHEHHSLIYIRPQLCFIKSTTSTKDCTTTNFLLEVFLTSSPRYFVQRRIKEYIEYLESSDWEEDFDSKPIALMACPSLAELIYCKRRVRRVLEMIGRSEDTHIRFATHEDIKREGVRAPIWEEA